jgi:hypothetical protein
MTPSQLVDRLIALLVREHGGTKHRWRKLIGPVQLYSLATHAHCNWSITPTGSHGEIARIEQLIDDLRMRHPILEGE